jgi:hypothetical protein
MAGILLRRMLGMSVDTEHHTEGFGGQDIGYLGSLCLVCNNVVSPRILPPCPTPLRTLPQQPHCSTPLPPLPPPPPLLPSVKIGPGMFALSALFQQAGWLPSIALMLLISVWTSQSALYLAQTMAGFSGNGDFNKRMEMGNTMFFLLPRWAYYLSMATLSIVFFSQNLANIVLTSQVMDYTLLDAFGQTCGLDYTSFKFYCVSSPGTDNSVQADSPFGYSFVISLGYLVVLVLCIPLGMLNLDDNIGFQIGGMLLTLVCVFVWFADFSSRGLSLDNMPALPSNFEAYPTLLSTVIFNYGFVATIPSWLNEKAPRVQVGPVVWWSVLAATAMFLLVSIPAALAVGLLPGSCNLLAVINGVCPVPDGNGNKLHLTFWRASKIMVFIFPIANILTSIPVFSIIIRYNLLQIHGVRVPVWLSNVFAVVLPWVVALPFFGGDGLNSIINWSSAIFFILLNLILPVWAYLQFAANEAAGLPRIDPDSEPVQGTNSSSLYSGGQGGGGGRSSVGLKSFAEANELLMREASQSLLAADSARSASLLQDSVYGDEETRAGFAVGGGAINSELSRSEGGSASGELHISPMPWLCGLRIGKDVERGYAYLLFVVSIVLALATLALQVYLTVDPPPSDDDDSLVVIGPLPHARPPPPLLLPRPLSHISLARLPTPDPLSLFSFLRLTHSKSKVELTYKQHKCQRRSTGAFARRVWRVHACF